MYAPSIIVDQIIDALAAVVALFIEDGQVVRAQTNRVPMPAAPCAVLTELLQVDLAVPYQDYDPTNGEALLTEPTRFDVQIDFYGPNAGQYCQAMKNALRTTWGFDQFPSNIKPMYTDNGVQAPLVTGEQQYESRWTLTVSLQYNPVVTVPQQFAEVLEATIEPPVDLQ